MNILLLKGYNNYFNRILKKKNTIADYKAAVVDGNILNYLDLTSINFNPNDGIDTTLVVGEGDLVWDEKGTHIDIKREGNHNPDYAIVYDIQLSEPVIHSRWFVTECERTRNGQYQIALKRDLLADFDDEIMSSPCFVEKGTIDTPLNPLLFNSEGVRFNEIKKGELLVKDATKCAWLVGYVKKDIDQPVQGITYTDPAELASYITTAADLPFSIDCIKFVDKNGNVTRNATKKLVWIANDKSKVKMRVGGNNNSFDSRISMTFDAKKDSINVIANPGIIPVSLDWENLNSVAMTATTSQHAMSSGQLKNISEDIIDSTTRLDYRYRLFDYLKQDAINRGSDLELWEEGGSMSLYFTYENKIYYLIVPLPQEFARDEYYTGEDSELVSYLRSLEGDYRAADDTISLRYNTSNPYNRKAKVEIRASYWPMVAQEIELGATITYDFPASTSRAQVRDAQYNIFAMPVMPGVLGMPVGNDDTVKIQYLSENDTVELDVSSISRYQLAMANAIMTKLGGDSTASKAYDLQLLPYCPFEFDVRTASYPTRTVIDLDSSGLTQSFDYDLIEDSDQNVKGIIFFARSSNFTKDIELSLPNEAIRDEVQVIENPTFTYNNGDYQGLPLFRMELPYPVADEQLTMDAVTLPSAITDGLVNSFISPVFTEGVKPAIYFTNSNMTGPYDPGEQVTFTGSQIEVLAHWILPYNALDTKVADSCDFQRLVSPNYNGMFQFKKSRMSNGVSLINVDCTYKPYSPYIKLNPNFSGLYGQDWNDSTGLICSGDFSIPMINDPFINYALQNKNYQAVFARGIENLDVNQQIARERQDVNAVIGMTTGAVGGGIAGAMKGAKGGAAGAIAGAALGAASGVAIPAIKYGFEKDWLARQQGETRSFAIDNFNYQLGNIQALPQSITKSSPLSYNNKVWPIIELFSCTDEEKEVLKNKLKYDGMTIMVIGKLEDYSVPGGYLKGKMIRLEGLKDDSHVADAIYQAVDRGFYKGE